jgi:hypothetical protein
MSANIENRLLLVELAHVYCSFQDWRQNIPTLPWRTILDHVISWLSLFNCSLSLQAHLQPLSYDTPVPFKVFYSYVCSFNTCKALVVTICSSIQISYLLSRALGNLEAKTEKSLAPYERKGNWVSGCVSKIFIFIIPPATFKSINLNSSLLPT